MQGDALLHLRPPAVVGDGTAWKRRWFEDPGAALPVPAVPGAERLVRAWSRSLDAGADPDGSHVQEHSILAAPALRDAQERLAPLTGVARPILEDFAASCAASDFVAVLADADGTVVRTSGGGAFADHARRVRLVEGARWSESLRGTNAIGTALAEGTSVIVEGAAHFARVNERLVCFATPIRDPFGDVVAVLDATSFAHRGAAFDPRMLGTIARAIEEVLRIRAWASSGGTGLDVVERLLERTTGPALLVEPPGRIARANATARQALAGHTRPLPAWHDLVALAGTTDAAADGPARSAALDRIQVEPILGRGESGDRILALLVFGEARAARARGSGHLVARPAGRADAFAAIVGDDPALEAARNECLTLASTDLPLLLLGETGTGKELFARAIHDASTRADGPFVAVNCGAIQPDLLVAELFGHGPGAFTGAARAGRDGLVAAADRGTLFLDEVADLTPAAQVALLRVLEDGSYMRVGEDRARRVSLRIVAATSRAMDDHLADGRFREDLYFRIGGARVELPPLRERRDFDLLLDHLWRRAAGSDTPPPLGGDARDALRRHPWRGNVRELRSALLYAAAFVQSSGAEAVGTRHLPRWIDSGRPTATAPATRAGTGGACLEDSRRAAVADALRSAGGNVSAAARSLGVARSTVYRLARRYGLEA